MTKKAHITSRVSYEIGDEVLSLCGKEYTVTTLWDDIPASKPICRKCVDTALQAMTEADSLIENARIEAMLANSRVSRLHKTLNSDELTKLDTIHEADLNHREKLQDQADAEAELERAKTTCTCTWTSPEVFSEDPDCPVHGGDKKPQEIETVELPDDTPPTDLE